MKNLKKVIAVLFCAMILMVTACSGSTDSDPYADAGKYVFQSMTLEGETITAEDLSTFGIAPSDMYVELKDDGTGSMVIFDESEDFKWTAGKITDSNGEVLEYTLKDGVMTLEDDESVMQFKLDS